MFFQLHSLDRAGSVKNDSERALGHQRWIKLFDEYKKKYPAEADQLKRIQRRELPDAWDQNLPSFPADAKGVATRESSGKVLPPGR